MIGRAAALAALFLPTTLPAAAEQVATAVVVARKIISAYSGKFVDPTLGDNDFPGQVFAARIDGDVGVMSVTIGVSD